MGSGRFRGAAGGGLTGFIASTGWLRVVEDKGADAVARHWRALAAGQIDPTEGLVLSV